MSLWVIIPSRGLAAGKARLARVLDDAERRVVNETLLRHSLDVVRQAEGGLERCIVVSPSEDSLALARSLGAEALEEPEEAGLNKAVQFAAGQAVSRGATRLIVLAADLPYLTVEALVGLVETAAAGEWVCIAADHASTGTNALVIPAALGFRFRFGEKSLVAHREEAVRIGLGSVVHRDDRIACDLDTADDLSRWQANSKR